MAAATITANEPSRLTRPQLPPGSWCSHMHVTSDAYPLSPNAKYRPQHNHSVADAQAYYATFGVENMVFVQPSIYGTDNSCLLDALRQVTPAHGRGVVELDPNTISLSTLHEWHSLGVRGVRVNLVSVGRTLSDDELAAELKSYADVIKPLDTWELEVYVPMHMCDALARIVPDLGVKFAIAHCGNPDLSSRPQPSAPLDVYSLPGFPGLISLLEQGSTWVKISAPYRFSKDPDLRDAEPLIKELLRVAPDRCVWASDWPHTRFEDTVDLTKFVRKCLEWTAGEGEVERREKLFRTNAEELFDVR